MRIGYARISSKDQSENRQIDALTEAGVVRENIFLDKVSGKNFDRPEWKTMMKVLRPGDTLVIQSLDRMGRNYDEIREQWKKLTDKGIVIEVIDLPILNTVGDSIGTLERRFLADVVLSILGYVAESERTRIKQRQTEGITSAKKRGKKFGRPQKQVDAKLFAALVKNVDEQKMTVEQACVILKISRRTFFRKRNNLQEVSD